MFNYDLAVRTLARVEIARIDGRWKQQTWAQKTDCGTAFCFAGWALDLEGRRFKWFERTLGHVTSSELEDGTPVDKAACDVLGIDYTAYLAYDEDGDEVCTEEALADERWDTDERMPALFLGMNDINDLYHQVYLWAVEDRPDLTPADVRRDVEAATKAMLTARTPRA